MLLSIHQPGNDALPLLMWIIGSIANVMSDTIFAAIEDIVCSAGDVDGINEAIFSEGIGKVPEGFFVAGGDEVELVIISSL